MSLLYRLSPYCPREESSCAKVDSDDTTNPVQAGRNAEESLQAQAAKVSAVAQKSIFRDVCSGLMNSRIIRAIVLTGASVAAFLALAANPTGWVIGGMAGLALLVTVVGQAIFDKGFGRYSFEISTLNRLWKNRNVFTDFDEIKYPKEWEDTIYLGSIPNKVGSFEDWVIDRDVVVIDAVLSLNEPWERKPLGISLPYTEKDWKALNITYSEIDCKDHRLLSYDQLDLAAEIINDQISNGKKIYVHCRAGKGRSAMAVAAYLIKYKRMTPLKAAQRIVQSRPKSTIMNKLGNECQKGLWGYYYNLAERKILEAAQERADDLDGTEEFNWGDLSFDNGNDPFSDDDSAGEDTLALY